MALALIHASTHPRTCSRLAGWLGGWLIFSMKPAEIEKRVKTIFKGVDTNEDNVLQREEVRCRLVFFC